MVAGDQQPVDPAGSPSQYGAAPDEPRWTASTGLVGLVVGLVGAVALAGVIAVVFAVFGSEQLDENEAFGFAATVAQELAFIGAALGVAAGVARPTARQFGFRPFGSSALGWALLAAISFYLLAYAYDVLANPPQDDLPRELGADESTAAAMITGVLVIAVAPPVEEFFFRGFLYQALRSRVGIWGAAALSGLIFGAIHLKPEFLVPLAILGMILCLLFQKTSSLWPCILVHMLNNTLAFVVTL